MESARSEITTASEGKVSATARSEVTDDSDLQWLQGHSEETPDKTPVEKYSTIHRRMLSALNASAVLKPLHTEIRNESYWYAMRKRMGPKRHNACIPKFSATYARWESYIYKMKVREEDAEVVPKKVMAGYHKTKWEAFRGCERACRERDENPATNKRMTGIIDPEKILSTHFRITVVSEQFYGLSYLQRVALVYDELIASDLLGCSVRPVRWVQRDGAFTAEMEQERVMTVNDGENAKGNTEEGESARNLPQVLVRAAPVRMKIGSTFGDAMCRLKLFRFLLSDQPLSLMVDARTPSQWRPHLYNPPVSERYGSSHMRLLSSHILDATKPKTQSKRVKKLTTTIAKNLSLAQKIQGMISATGVPASSGAPPTATGGSSGSRAGSRADGSRAGTGLLPPIGGPRQSGVIGGTTVGIGGGGIASDGSVISAGSSVSGDQSSAASAGVGLSDTLGLDPQVSGVRYKKLGGIYGHFFNDLSPGVRELVMSKYKDNKRLIQLEGSMTLAPASLAGQQQGSGNTPKKKRKKTMLTAAGVSVSASVSSDSMTAGLAEAAAGGGRGGVGVFVGGGTAADFIAAAAEAALGDQPSFRPQTNVSKLKKKMENAKIQASYDKGTDTEAEMMEELNISNRKAERAVIRLQRIRRITVFHRAQKYLWWRWYASITIQRCVRGLFGRQYASLFQKLRPLAAIRIQRAFRYSRTVTLIKMWRYLSFRLTRVVLPKIKRFIRNCFLSWMYKRNGMATRIQGVARVRIARARYYREVGRRYYIDYVFPRAIVYVQKVIRGFLGRRRAHRRLAVFLVHRIDVPAATRIQRAFRGYLGRLLAAQRAYEFYCLVRLQTVARAFVRQRWDDQLAYEQRRKFSAIQIQRVFRGAVDRELVRLRRYIRWYKFTYIPSIVRAQAVARRYRARKEFFALLQRRDAAVRVQTLYRNYLLRLQATEVVRQIKLSKRFFAATKIQTMIRRHLAQRRFRRLLIEHRGKITHAARVILRAWCNFKIAKAFQNLLEDHKVKYHTGKIRKLIDTRKELAADLAELKVDLELAEKVAGRLKIRIRQLDTFLAQGALRQARVKKEMSKLTAEDFEKGWAEALGQEYEMLSHQSLMAREEIRLLRSKQRGQLREIEQLYLEEEELEIEMDAVEVLQIELSEAIRRAEVLRIERIVRERFARLVRQERSHWKVESTRMNVIRRNRPRYQTIVAKVKEARDEEYATTIEFEKRERVRDREQILRDQLLAAEGRRIDRDSRPRSYTEYAAPVQQTYDSVVAGTQQLLRGFSLEERASRLREQYKTREATKKRGQKGQFHALKEESSR